VLLYSHGLGDVGALVSLFWYFLIVIVDCPFAALVQFCYDRAFTVVSGYWSDRVSKKFCMHARFWQG
jgi:hypothetical protein